MFFYNDDDPQKVKLLELIGRENIPCDDLSVISEKELKRLLLNCDVTITRYSIDDNNYGRFMFIHFIIGKVEYFVYGLGLHEHRQKLYKDVWEFTTCSYNMNFKGIPINPAKVFQAIKQRKIDIKDLKAEPDSSSAKFNALADISDDDYALVNL